MPKQPKRRADGRYQAKVKTGRYLPDGKPEYKIVYGRTKAELDAAKEEAKKQAGLGDYRDATVAEWLKVWLRIKKHDIKTGDLSDRTYDGYEAVVDKHIVPIIGPLKLAKLQPQNIRAMLEKKRDDGLGDRRIQYIYVVLKAALKQAVADRAILWNPCLAVKKPSVKEREYIVITEKQYNAIIEAAQNSALRLICKVAWDTGLRLEEILGLPWRCINFRRNTITVEQAVKRSKALGLHIATDLKSKNSYRTVPITAEVAVELKAHKKSQNEHINAYGLKYQTQHDLVFAQEDGTPKDPGNVSSAFGELRDRLGLPKGLHFHDLRHTYATYLAEQNVHPKKMQLLLGHATSAFTMDKYTHKSDDMLKGIKATIEKRRGSQKVVKPQKTKKQKASEK